MTEKLQDNPDFSALYLYRNMKKHHFLASVWLLPLFASLAANADTFLCEGQVPGAVKFSREVKISVGNARTHLISLVPLEKDKEGIEYYSGIPVGLGTIQITEQLENSRLVIAQGKLIVTDRSENVIAGVLIHEGRQYALRMDKENKKWSFILHDTNKRETVSGSCK